MAYRVAHGMQYVFVHTCSNYVFHGIRNEDAELPEDDIGGAMHAQDDDDSSEDNSDSSSNSDQDSDSFGSD